MSNFSDFFADVISAPAILASHAVDLTIKTVESIPEIVEAVAEKVEDAFEKVGQ